MTADRRRPSVRLPVRWSNDLLDTAEEGEVQSVDRAHPRVYLPLRCNDAPRYPAVEREAHYARFEIRMQRFDDGSLRLTLVRVDPEPLASQSVLNRVEPSCAGLIHPAKNTVLPGAGRCQASANSSGASGDPWDADR